MYVDDEFKLVVLYIHLAHYEIHESFKRLQVSVSDNNVIVEYNNNSVKSRHSVICKNDVMKNVNALVLVTQMFAVYLNA